MVLNSTQEGSIDSTSDSVCRESSSGNYSTVFVWVNTAEFIHSGNGMPGYFWFFQPWSNIFMIFFFQYKKNFEDISGGTKWFKISPIKRLWWSAPNFKGPFIWYDSYRGKTVFCMNTIIEIRATYSKMKLWLLSHNVNIHIESIVTYYLRQLLSQSLSCRVNGPLIRKNGARPNQWQQPPR